MRCVAAILALCILSAARADAHTLIWISGSATHPGVSEQPNLRASGADNKFYIWGRPEDGETLHNVSLNVISTNDAVLNFTAVDVTNPLLGTIAFPPPPKEILRFQFVNDPEPTSEPDQIINFGGFTIATIFPLGIGMGPDTASLDSGYNVSADAFHIATVTYDVLGPTGSTTDVFLQIGPNGMNNVGASSRQLNVIFGVATDAPLNAYDARQINSATYDARITVGEEEVPEPATAVLILLALWSLSYWPRSPSL